MESRKNKNPFSAFVVAGWEKGDGENDKLPPLNLAAGEFFDDFEVDYYDYECGKPCTPDGCMGHSTNIPVSIHFGGIIFTVQGWEGGDFPDNERAERVKEVVGHLGGLISPPVSPSEAPTKSAGTGASSEAEGTTASFSSPYGLTEEEKKEILERARSGYRESQRGAGRQMATYRTSPEYYCVDETIKYLSERAAEILL